MKAPRPFKIAKRVFLDLRNDKRSLALMFIAPVFAMLVFGFAFSGEVSDVGVTVVNLDSGAQLDTGKTVRLSEEIIDNVDREVMKIGYADTEDAAVREVENGKSYAAVIFPESFTADVLEKQSDPSFSGDTTIKLMEDKSNVNVASAITKEMNSALLKTMEEMGKEPAVYIDSSDAIYGENAKFIDFFVPGIMAFAVFIITTLLTLVSFVGERTSGTLERMLSTPVSESDVVMGYSSAFSVTGIMQSALLLLVGIVVFRITIVGNVVLAFAVIALLAVVSQALGILLSSLAKRESQVVQFLPFVIIPGFLLAGVFWPLEAIPSWLRPLSYAVPPTYAVDACRSVMLRGWGIGKIWLDIVVLLAFAVVFLFLAVLSLKAGKD